MSLRGLMSVPATQPAVKAFRSRAALCRPGHDDAGPPDNKGKRRREHTPAAERETRPLSVLEAVIG